MTPTRKGLYTQCVDCLYNIKEPVKYPCSKSHKAIRVASNERYERDFKVCGLYKRINDE